MPAFRMSDRSLFAILLRKPWWVSAGLAALLSLLLAALLPAGYKLAGALSSFPFWVISVLALKRQWGQPTAAQAEALAQHLATLAWGDFAALMRAGLEREGHEVRVLGGTRGAQDGAADFITTRAGRTRVVAARRWKAARVGVEPLRALQARREALDTADAAMVTLGEVPEAARAYASAQGIELWQAGHLAALLRDLPPAARR